MIEEITNCSRCSRDIGNEWWQREPNYGYIKLGYAAQAFGALCRAKDVALDEHFVAHRRGHKAMTKDSAQEVVFEYGYGSMGGVDSTTRYLLCHKCQKDLLGLIGGFFGYGVQSFKNEQKATGKLSKSPKRQQQQSDQPLQRRACTHRSVKAAKERTEPLFRLSPREALSVTPRAVTLIC